MVKIYPKRLINITCSVIFFANYQRPIHGQVEALTHAWKINFSLFCYVYQHNCLCIHIIYKMKINYSNENWTDLGLYSKFYNSTYTKIPLEDHNLHQQKSPQFQTQIYLVKVPLNVSVEPWHNGVLTQRCIKWGIEKDPSAPLLLQKTDMNLFSLKLI